MIKEVKNIKDSLDTILEISELLKLSPKLETLFKKLKEDLAPEFPGLRMLCPTRWTVCGGSLQNVIENVIGMYYKNYGTSVWKQSWNRI